jgi:DNA polymerase (family X)
MERVIEAAARAGTMIEINSSPDRRDLNDVHVRAAVEAGVRILINSDAHAAIEFDQLRYGIATARRGWLTADHVANTRSFKEFQKLRKRR